MPTIKLSDIRREADKQHGDVKIAMTDDVDDQGEPTDYVALVKTIRLSEERRDQVKALRKRMEDVRADAPEVAEQRKVFNAAQNRLDSANENISEKARDTLEKRVAQEERKLDELIDKAQEESDEGAIEREMRDSLVDLITTIARTPDSGRRLVEATKTDDMPDGDLSYLMELFKAYQRGGASEDGGDDTGEASPSQT